MISGERKFIKVRLLNIRFKQEFQGASKALLYVQYDGDRTIVR